MKIAPDQIDPDAAKVVERLRRYDHKAYLVGGCVRDLLLELKPKDFDVVTSATPPDIKRLFRNCRIIGRRFRLAHVFFGPKIIETSTFRANPREVEEEDAAGGPETETGDLLIRRDNVFGTPEEDARRRDFTINGLFYDIETAEVIDHVGGMADLEARLVRTIGDPDIRLREDPVRILRAVKFAARCSLAIEPETYRRMMEHRQEITKCAQARVSEEFYRLLRQSAAKRSMELLLEMELLDIMVPELAKGLRDTDDSEDAVRKRARLWSYLGALDRQSTKRPTPPSNALILAALSLPPLRDVLDPDSTGIGDVGKTVALAIAPLVERLKASRRDAELTRQMLLALRYVLPSQRPNRRRPRLAGRDFLDDALRLAELVSDAETLEPTLAGRPIAGLGAPAPSEADDAQLSDEELAPELEPIDAKGGRWRGRRGRDRRPGQGADLGAPREQGANGDVAPRQPERGAPSAPRGPYVPSSYRQPAPLATGTPALDALAATLPPPLFSERPSFLGIGTFGGPWAARD
ncbi:MAG TPA: polynucleotide adenylyltransferase PcnB [Polyangia bacterium]|jgi:poly(A) polymerase